MTTKNKPINDSDFAILADCLPDFVARYDSEGKIIYLNKKLQSNLGKDINEMVGRKLSEIYPDGSFSDLEKKILLCAGSGNDDFLDLTVPISKEKTEFHHLRIVPERNFNNEVIGVLIIGRDMTERLSLEQKLTTASRMASLGEMAGGIAHEINNPLAIIKGKCYQLAHLPERGMFSEESVLKIAADIERTSNRIEKVVKGLKSFSRDASGDPFKPEIIQNIISDSLSICEQKIKNTGTELVIQVDKSKLITAECRSAQISQILINLISNAHDAIKDISSAKIIVVLEDKGDFVEISVEDSGHGIPEDIRNKIMQPFFTTKPAGVGTGLGLSICKSIALSHHGDIRLDSNSQNTRFVVSLPKIYKSDYATTA